MAHLEFHWKHIIDTFQLNIIGENLFSTCSDWSDFMLLYLPITDFLDRLFPRDCNPLYTFVTGLSYTVSHWDVSTIKSQVHTPLFHDDMQIYAEECGVVVCV